MKNLLSRWRAKAGIDARQNADVRRALVETLYASPTSLTVGAIAGSAVSIAVARVAEDACVTFMAVLICLTAASRVVSATYFHRSMTKGVAKGSRNWELAYELGAWIYAALLGLLAFIVLFRSDNAIIHMLAVSLATGYSGGISGRNAGRVHIAIGQVFLSLAPTALGLWLVGDTGYRILSLVLVLMIPGMAEISNTTHRIVLEALTGKQQ